MNAPTTNRRTLRWGNVQTLHIDAAAAFATVTAQVIRASYDVPLSWTVDLIATIENPQNTLPPGGEVDVIFQILLGVGSAKGAKHFTFRFLTIAALPTIIQDYSELQTNRLEAYTTLTVAGETVDITPTVLAGGAGIGVPVDITLSVFTAPIWMRPSDLIEPDYHRIVRGDPSDYSDDA